jgi:hypothetical protein
MKKTWSIIGLSSLVLIAAWSAGAYAVQGQGPNDEEKDDPLQPPSETAVAQSDPVTIVYYFYTKKRCASCLKIEEYTKEAVETFFAKELESGRMIWRPVNMEDPEHAHFMDDFDLFTKSVVLVRQKGDRMLKWKNLPKIWELLNDKTAFIDYIHKEIRLFPGER